MSGYLFFFIPPWLTNMFKVAHVDITTENMYMNNQWEITPFFLTELDFFIGNVIERCVNK